MAKASGHSKPKKAGKRKVTHIHVERAGNGFTVSHRMEPQKKMQHGSMMDQYEEPQNNVFNDKDAMMAHVGGLAGQMGDNEEAEGEGAPPPAPGA